MTNNDIPKKSCPKNKSSGKEICFIGQHKLTLVSRLTVYRLLKVANTSGKYVLAFITTNILEQIIA